jgi:ComF family protein
MEGRDVHTGTAWELLRACGQRCRDAARPWLDIVYPACCLRCGERIRAEDVLCAICVADMVPYPVTPQASEDHLAALRYRAAASMMTVGYEFESEGSVSACIHTMKYRGMHRVAHWMGRMIGERLAGSPLIEGEPALVPVPLHPVKLVERGFNQAEEICKGIAQETGLPVFESAMRRVRYTQSQAAMKLHVDERKSNVMNAFEPDAAYLGMVRERPVLLVDDLITTGATIGECGLALREQGAKDVRYAAIAKPPV